MTHTFNEAEGLFGASGEQQAEVELLRDFQLWLEDGGAYDVIVHSRRKFAPPSGEPPAQFASGGTPSSIAAISASAGLDKAQREVDGHGHRRNSRRLRTCLGCVQSRRFDLLQSAVRGGHYCFGSSAREDGRGRARRRVAKQAAGGGPDIRLKPSYLSGGETPDVTVTATARVWLRSWDLLPQIRPRRAPASRLQPG